MAVFERLVLRFGLQERIAAKDVANFLGGKVERESS